MTDNLSCYAPLDKSSRDIRLLILLPTRHKDKRLQAKLVIKSLYSNPEYEALSYTWGLPDDHDFKIWLNGVLVPVRRNLLCALRVLQRRMTRRVLWVDAVCINQNDDAEKGHQVGMMGDVYKKASRVVAWLGTPDLFELNNTSLDTQTSPPKATPLLAFSYLKDGYKAIPPAYKKSSKNYRLIASGWWRRMSIWQWDEHYLQGEQHFRHRFQVVGILNLDYWTRIWIVQEICLGTEVKLLYGTKSLDWKLLCLIFRVIESAPSRTEFCSQIAKSSAKAVFEISGLGFTYTDNLRETIQLTTKSACHDRRDKIYAILGLQSPTIQSLLKVDYAGSLLDLYCRVMKIWVSIIQDSQPVQIADFSYILQQSLSRSADFEMPRSIFDYETQPLPNSEDCIRPIAISARFFGILEVVCDNLADLIQSPIPKTLTACFKSGPEWIFDMISSSRKTYLEKWMHFTEQIWKTDQHKLKLFSSLNPSHISDDASGPDHKDSAAGLSVFLTGKGAVGLVPKGIQAGDELWELQVRTNRKPHWLIFRTSQSLERQVLGRAIVCHPERLLHIHGRPSPDESYPDHWDMFHSLDDMLPTLIYNDASAAERNLIMKWSAAWCAKLFITDPKTKRLPLSERFIKQATTDNGQFRRETFQIPMSSFQVLTAPLTHDCIQA